MDRIMKGLENRTDAFLKEAHCIREALEASAMVESSATSTIIEAYLFDIEAEVREFTDERLRLIGELAAVRASIGVGSSDRLATAQRLLDQAVLERGSDRGLLLREVRNTLIEISNSESIVHPIIWLLLGWTTWQLTESPLEAAPILARVAQHAVPSMATALSYRLLSYFAEQDEQPAKALEWAKMALDVRVTADICLDAGLTAAGLHDPSTAKSSFESALVQRASALLPALCDDRALLYGSELLEVAVRVQMRMRREGRQAITAWAAAAREVAEAQRICAGGLHVPYELMEGHKQTLDRLASADLITGGYLTRSSRENAVEVIDHAKKSLQGEYVKRCDAVSLARRSIESASAFRESRIEAAMRQQEEVRRRAEAALSGSDIEAEKAEKGSIFGFASGCALFALYMISYLILADRGTVIGAGTPVGFTAISLSAIPIVVAVAIQVRHALRRIALEARCNEVIKRAATSYEEASQEADDVYREQMKHHRKALSTADAELRKVESAMRHLGLHRASPEGVQTEDPETEEAELENETATEPETDQESEPDLEELDDAHLPAA